MTCNFLPAPLTLSCSNGEKLKARFFLLSEATVPVGKLIDVFYPDFLLLFYVLLTATISVVLHKFVSIFIY